MILPVGRGDECSRMAPWLPGLLDRSLPPGRHCAVSAHVETCERCRAEVDKLGEVRRLLGSRGGDHAPSDLTGRLIQIAGEDAAQPLWLRGGAGNGSLPSRRARRVRAVRRFAASGTVAVLAVLSLALLMAPSLPKVTDPGEQAHRSFSRSMTALGMDELVVAVLAASDAGASLRTEPSFEASAPLLGPAQPLPATQAADMLTRLRRPEGWLAGTQQVSLRDGGVYRIAEVRMEERPEGVLSVSVLDASGNRVTTGAFGQVTRGIDGEFLANTRVYGYPPDGTRIAGREVAMLEARIGGMVLARWWFTGDDHLLRSERYGADGSVTLSAGYTQVAEPGPAVHAVSSVISTAPLRNARTAVSLECGLAEECPRQLAGLPLVRYSASGTADAPHREFVYSDGITVLCVTRQKGWLAPDGVPMEDYLRRGSPLVRSWQSGTEVVTITTNGPEDIAQRAHDELPRQTAARPDLGWRIGAGLRRLAGVGGD